MGILKKQSINAAVISILGIVLGAFTTLIFQTKYLSPEMIGLISTLREVATILSSFVVLGAPSIINRFYPYYKNEKFKEFNFLVHLLTAVGLGVLAILLFLNQDFIVRKFAANSPLFVKYTYLILPFTFLWCIKYLYEPYAKALYKITIPKLINEVIFRMFFLVLIFLYTFIGFSDNTLIHAYVFLIFISSILTYLYANHLKKIRFINKLDRFSFAELKEMVVYGFFSILNTTSSSIVAKIDIIMISSLSGLEKSGIYAISMFMSNVVEVPRRSINNISVPFIAQAWKNNDVEKLSELYKKSAINQLIAGTFIFTIIWINIDNIFRIMPNGEYFSSGKYVFFFLGFAKLIDLSMGINSEIIELSKHYKINILISVGLVIVTLISNYLLIPIYGIVGASIATAISIFSYNLLRFLVLYFAFKIHPFNLKYLYSLSILVFMFFILNILPSPFKPIFNILYLSTICISLFFISIYYLNISIELKLTLIKFLSRFKNL